MDFGDHRHLDRIALKRASSYHIQGESSNRNDPQPGRSRSRSRGVSCHGFPSAQRSVSSKNIAMRVDPVANDWSNFTMNQVKTPGQRPQSHKHPTSNLSTYSRVKDVPSKNSSYVSQTTIARGQSREVLPHSHESHTRLNVYSNSDSFSKLDLNTKADSSLESQPGKPVTLRGGDHSSISSIAPVTRSDSDTESEADKHDESKLPFLEPSEDYYGYEDVQNVSQDFENITSVFDFMNGIEKPKVDPHTFRSTRTQQKLDDMKSLLGDSDSEPAKMGMADFSVRIQNEAISSQWNQIRLRFSNYLHQNHKRGEENGNGKAKNGGTSLECHAGILGSLKRLQGIEIGPSHQSLVSRDYVQDYLSELWNSGLTVEAQSKSPSYQEINIPGTRHASSVGAGSDGDIYQSRERFDVSRLAKNVMSSRDEEHETTLQ